MNTNSSEALIALILISLFLGSGWISLLKNEQAVVAKIFEVEAELFKEFIFFIFEEVFVLFNKLSDNVSEQLEGIWQVLPIVVRLAANTDNLFENGFLSQNLEAVFILTEFLQDGVSIECHLEIILIFARKLVNEEIDNVIAFFFENLLHELLFSS